MERADRGALAGATNRLRRGVATQRDVRAGLCITAGSATEAADVPGRCFARHAQRQLRVMQRGALRGFDSRDGVVFRVSPGDAGDTPAAFDNRARRPHVAIEDGQRYG